MPTLQIILNTLLAVMVLLGISLMSRVKTAVAGNLLSALALFVGVVATLLFNGIVSAWTLWPSIIVGAWIGSMMARRVQMIQMPQTVALFNGLGGGASALVGLLSIHGATRFEQVTALLAIAIGTVTLVGSLVAAGKLHRILNQRPVVYHSALFHSVLTYAALFFTLWAVVDPIRYGDTTDMTLNALAAAVGGTLFGWLFSIRVGGADMPITISLLNSLSGVAGAIAGMAIGDVFLVAVGGIVGASGLLLTQIMCRAMNRSLTSILLATPKTPKTPPTLPTDQALIKRVMDLEKRIQELEAIVKNLEGRVQTLTTAIDSMPAPSAATPQDVEGTTAASVLRAAKDVIIVPGYGMALAQAQHQVHQLATMLERRGARVRYAIHPVAGRMPGHMNVLLAEADVDYEQLYEMEAINDDFATCDAVVVIGANDVLNPAARHAEGTPIYGMPVLNVDQAPQVIICNYDLKPGYAGVENPLYSRQQGVFLELGDAKETLQQLMSAIG